jgi:hypothetical protein
VNAEAERLVLALRSAKATAFALCSAAQLVILKQALGGVHVAHFQLLKTLPSNYLSPTHILLLKNKN